MNREIKFRAWLDDGYDIWMDYDFYIRANGDVYEGSFDPHDEPVKEIQKSDCFTLMQYTGYKDCHGKEIYEGDIVQIFGYGSYVVEFPFIELYEAAIESDIGEILGNIYQNPELLENDDDA